MVKFFKNQHLICMPGGLYKLGKIYKFWSLNSMKRYCSLFLITSSNLALSAFCIPSNFCSTRLHFSYELQWKRFSYCTSVTPLLIDIFSSVCTGSECDMKLVLTPLLSEGWSMLVGQVEIDGVGGCVRILRSHSFLVFVYTSLHTFLNYSWSMLS